jgi:hypothetical protein
MSRSIPPGPTPETAAALPSHLVSASLVADGDDASGVDAVAALVAQDLGAD